MSEALQQEIRHLHALEGSARDPHGRVFLPLADAYLRSGDHARAEELLVDGLARHPDFVAAHVLAARLREAQGNLDGAELAWATARRMDPENVEVLFGLGRIMASRGEEIGVELVERARALDPTAGRTTAPAPPAAPSGTDVDVVSIADLAPDVAVPSGMDAAPVNDEADVISIADLAPDVVAEIDEHDDDGDEDDSPGIMPMSELAPSSPRESGRAHGNGERRVVTRTLAELLVSQGQHPQALDMYETLVERSPDDDALRSRLDELRASGGAPATGDDEDLHHHPSAPEPVPDAPTPFAWTEPSDTAVAPEASGPSVSTYFEGLLSWSPSNSDEDA